MFLKNGTIKSAFGGRFMENPLPTQAMNRSRSLSVLGAETAKAR